MSQGVLYVAEGPDYAALAVQSIRTLRRHEPDLAADLMTDSAVPEGLFDRVSPLRPGRRAKIAGMAASRFERTLFLDCDTLVVAPFGDVWDILDRFDLALSHDVRRSSALIETGWREPAPDVFPQHNSGVMLYRRSPAMAEFFAAWAAAYDAAGGGRDQVTLRDLLFASELRFWVLPPEWNLRRVTELDAWEPLDAIPRVIHSHQLVRHLRHGAEPVTTLEQILDLERAALAREWDELAARTDLPDELAQRFALARRARRE